MTTERDDGALRAAFAELRRDDAARVPALAAVLQRETAPRPALIALRRGALAAGLIAASLATGLLVRRPATPPPLAIRTWTAPTDFLLRTPGIEVLESVPRIAPRRSLLALDGVVTGPPSHPRSPSP